MSTNPPDRIDPDWERSELIPFLRRVFEGQSNGYPVGYDFHQAIRHAESMVKTIRHYDDSAVTIEKIRLGLSHPEALAHPDIAWGMDISAVKEVTNDIELCLIIFVRHAITNGYYPLASLGADYHGHLAEQLRELAQKNQLPAKIRSQPRRGAGPGPKQFTGQWSPATRSYYSSAMNNQSPYTVGGIRANQNAQGAYYDPQNEARMAIGRQENYQAARVAHGKYGQPGGHYGQQQDQRTQGFNYNPFTFVPSQGYADQVTSALEHSGQLDTAPLLFSQARIPTYVPSQQQSLYTGHINADASNKAGYGIGFVSPGHEGIGNWVSPSQRHRQDGSLSSVEDLTAKIHLHSSKTSTLRPDAPIFIPGGNWPN